MMRATTTQKVRKPRRSSAGRSPIEEIYALLDDEKWTAARRKLLVKLKNEPDSHWVLDRIAYTYHEQYRYREALAYSRRALRLAPRCLLVLFDYANTLCMLGHRRRAVAIWRMVIGKGTSYWNAQACSQGRKSDARMINDVRLLLGLALLRQRSKKAHDEGEKLVRTYIGRRNRGVESEYGWDWVIAQLEPLPR